MVGHSDSDHTSVQAHALYVGGLRALASKGREVGNSSRRCSCTIATRQVCFQTYVCQFWTVQPPLLHQPQLGSAAVGGCATVGTPLQH